eukprot:366213-Chlamydomonas_euryale.AAC.2
MQVDVELTDERHADKHDGWSDGWMDALGKGSGMCVRAVLMGGKWRSQGIGGANALAPWRS